MSSPDAVPRPIVVRASLLFVLATALVCSCSSTKEAPATGAGAQASADASIGAADATGSGSPASVDGGALGSAFAEGELDPPSNGGTITFEDIGAPGWYPRVQDPAVGSCDVSKSATCCLGRHEVTGNALTPWDQDLIMTLRGPLLIKQLAVYQPASAGGDWSLVAAWNEQTKGAAFGLSFDGKATLSGPFDGSVASECLVNLASAETFACGTGSDPYCPNTKQPARRGFAGSKLFVLLARMPHTTDVPGACSKGATTGNWYDAPWIGLSLGELARAGAFSSCQCYAKDPSKWYLGDGCGQFNVFEVVNDNNASKNLDVFSTNFFGYAGYVGEGPCGAKCNASAWPATLDLVDKAKNTEAAAGAIASPSKGPGAALRRPIAGYRYFLVGLDVTKRSVQLGVVHPSKIPTSLAPLLPALPSTITPANVDALFTLRLPK